ncbi:hypothetical protein GJ496_010197 [Pomphorhynchus laevis]|nr:hypothetical protein GJ496_010197 [Pomphorhynchus laevis]
MDISKELKALNFPEKNELRNQLAESDDPLREIANFQHAHQINVPSVQSLLPMLDAIGQSQTAFHESLLKSLKDRFLVKLETLHNDSSIFSQKIINSMLENNFVLITVEPLQDIILAILKYATEISPDHIQYLQTDMNLYNRLPIEAKRLIWMDDTGFFEAELTTKLEMFVKALEDHSKSNQDDVFQCPPPVFQDYTGLRPEFVQTLYNHLQALLSLVGCERSLCQHAVRYTLSMFLNCRNRFYSTACRCILDSWRLNSQFVKTFNNFHSSSSDDDAELDDLNQSKNPSITYDAVDKFSQLLCDCVNRRQCSGWTLHALDQSFCSYQSFTGESDFGSMLFLLSDPFVTNCLGSSILKIMYRSVEDGGNLMMNTGNDLTILTRLLCNGLSAWFILTSREAPTFEISAHVCTDIYPSLMYLITDLREEGYNPFNNSSTPPLSPFDEQFLELIDKDRLCNFLWQLLTIDLVQTYQISSFCKISRELSAGLEAIAIQNDNLIPPRTFNCSFLVDSYWLHQLGCALVRCCLQLVNGENRIDDTVQLLDVVLNDIIKTASKSDLNRALLFAYNFVHSLFQSLPAFSSIYRRMLEKVKPPEHSEILWQKYIQLRTSLENSTDVRQLDNCEDDLIFSVPYNSNIESLNHDVEFELH